MKFLKLLNCLNKIGDSLPPDCSTVCSSDGKKLYKKLNQVTIAIRISSHADVSVKYRCADNSYLPGARFTNIVVRHVVRHVIKLS